MWGKKVINFNSNFRSKILFNKKLSDFVETFTYFYQIPYSKNVKVWTKLNNFLLNKIFVGILTHFFAPDLTSIGCRSERTAFVICLEKFKVWVPLVKWVLCLTYPYFQPFLMQTAIFVCESLFFKVNRKIHLASKFYVKKSSEKHTITISISMLILVYKNSTF